MWKYRWMAYIIIYIYRSLSLSLFSMDSSNNNAQREATDVAAGLVRGKQSVDS